MNNDQQIVYTPSDSEAPQRINPARAEAQTDGSQKSQIADAEGDVANVDEFSEALETIDVPHAHIHEGKMFDMCELATITSGSNRDYLVITGANKFVHFKVTCTADGKGDVAIYEEPTTSANGTGMAELNRNRASAITPEVTVFHTPTVSAVGTMLCDELFGSGNKSGGETRADNEWVLKKNTKYLIRVHASANIDVSTKMNWYES